ncbi:MAG: MFS transporter [Spirochaetales bacterium]|nr:MFS transporter [Spirochaetales bacterium]
MKPFFPTITDRNINKALFYSVIDGILWAVMYGFAENNIVLFALFFKATALQVSLMQGSMQFGVSMAQLIGARVVRRLRKRKLLSICCNILHAISFLIIVYGAFLTRNPLIILIAFACGAFANNIASPGWISWMNDIVPVKVRGTFWGTRNRIINFVMFCAIIVAGLTLHVMRENGIEYIGFILLFTIASLSRLSSVIPLAKQYEPPLVVTPDAETFKFRIFLRKLATTNFGRFALFSFLLTFSVNIMAPVIPVFLIKSLGFNYIQFTIVMMSSMVSTFLAMRYWGTLSDSYGNYRIVLVTALSLPLITIGWAVVKNFYILIIIQLFSGFVWSGFNLSSQNYIFDSVKAENIPKISAYFTSLNNISAFAGSVTGGVLTILTKQFAVPFFAAYNFELIFLFSGALRFLIIVILIKQFSEVRKVEPSPGIRHFYIFYPMANIINRFKVIIDRFAKKTG